MRTVWWRPGPTGSSTRPRRWRWNCTCIWRSTWNRTRKEISIYLGAVGLYVVGPDPGTQHRLELPNGAKPKWARHGLQLLCTPEPRGQIPGAGAQPVGFGDGRCTFGITSPAYPGMAQHRPNAGIQPVKLAPHRFAFERPTPGDGDAGHADRTGRSTYGTLWVTGQLADYQRQFGRKERIHQFSP